MSDDCFRGTKYPPKPQLLSGGYSRPRVYVAGSGYNLERVRAVIRQLEAGGVEITRDWTRQVEALGGMNGADWKEARIHAVLDFEAVRDADAVLLLTPPKIRTSPGAHVELGMALALGVPVVVSRGTVDNLEPTESIFYSMADVVTATDAEGAEAVARLAARSAEMRNQEDSL